MTGKNSVPILKNKLENTVPKFGIKFSHGYFTRQQPPSPWYADAGLEDTTWFKREKKEIPARVDSIQLLLLERHEKPLHRLSGA